jgi:hypothetical protein
VHWLGRASGQDDLDAVNLTVDEHVEVLGFFDVRLISWQNMTAKLRAETKILDPARDREEGNRVCPLRPAPGGRQAFSLRPHVPQ